MRGISQFIMKNYIMDLLFFRFEYVASNYNPIINYLFLIEDYEWIRDYWSKRRINNGNTTR